MRTEATPVVALAGAVAQAAAQWRDPASRVRTRARAALAGGAWPAAVVETALDNVLWDLDEPRASELCRAASCNGAFSERALVVLPGNIIGPAIQSAFCAVVAGARAVLKASSAERELADIVSRQFADLGAPLAGRIQARHWRGGDLDAEAAALAESDRVIVFGEDATIDQIRTRAQHRPVICYGQSYSIGYVHAQADVGQAAAAAARDICLFDQRGCMSPQTIFVAGDPGKALLFAHALAHALTSAGHDLPRAAFEAGEPARVSDVARRLAATALAPLPHGLDTLLRGPLRDGVPEFIVAVEGFGQPTCIGFGRVAIVKHAPSARDVATQIKYLGLPLETIGLAAQTPASDRSALRMSGARRICALGEMQRPPFGYRPTPGDFR